MDNPNIMVRYITNTIKKKTQNNQIKRPLTFNTFTIKLILESFNNHHYIRYRPNVYLNDSINTGHTYTQTHTLATNHPSYIKDTHDFLQKI